MDSRTMKLQSLSAIYARERSPEALREMKKEMESMQRFDDIFHRLAVSLKLTGSYNPADINFDCMRQNMEAFENKCGKLSDYGLSQVKYFAEAC